MFRLMFGGIKLVAFAFAAIVVVAVVQFCIEGPEYARQTKQRSAERSSGKGNHKPVENYFFSREEAVPCYERFNESIRNCIDADVNRFNGRIREAYDKGDSDESLNMERKECIATMHRAYNCHNVRVKT